VAIRARDMEMAHLKVARRDTLQKRTVSATMW